MRVLERLGVDVGRVLEPGNAVAYQILGPAWDELLFQGESDTHHDPTLDLPFDRLWIDHRPHVVRHVHRQYFYLPGVTCTSTSTTWVPNVYVSYGRP